MAAQKTDDESRLDDKATSEPGHGSGFQLAPGDFMDRTFMGGIGLSARTSLFVMVGLICLAAGGFGLFRAQEDLVAAQSRLADAYELARLVDTVEATALRIRGDGLLLRQSSSRSPESIEAHITRAIELGRLLDRIYERFDAASLGEHITTLREALAQYAEAFETDLPSPKTSSAEDTADLANAVDVAARALQDRLQDINILSLSKTIVDMRAAEAAFIKTGKPGSLVAINNGQDAFTRLMGMVPLTDTESGDLVKLMAIYQNRLTDYAKSRMVRSESDGRIDEIFSYMAPSLDALRGYAGQRLTVAINEDVKLREFYLPLIALVGVGLLLLMWFTGILILRSVTRPFAAAAEAGRRIAEGDLNAVVWGLGNDDETGDVARAFSTLKLRLGEIPELHESLDKAKTEAERGRAATEEADWLRRDLESMKADLAKGQDAIEETELLHKVIEAMRSDFQESNAQNLEARRQLEEQAEVPPATPEPEPQPEPEIHNLDSISEISQLVAQSSQSVTAAAEEAERTGTLIRNLNDASKRITGIETLVNTISDQADLLWVGGSGGGSDDTGSGSNLVMFSQDQRAEDGTPTGPRPDRPEMESSIGRRFDIIRATASQTTWALRDINNVVLEARNLALGIAQTTSAEALHVTTDLLEQSENLRYMLDSLVHKMRDQLNDEMGESARPTDLDDQEPV